MALSRLVVTSIGHAGPAVSLALARHLPWPQEEIARRLYQAPSELLRGLTESEADAILDVLRAAGLEVERQDETSPFTAGDGVWDVALHLEDPARTAEVLDEVGRFLGASPEEAGRVLFQSPALLLGRVSEATVAAVRARFAPLGVEVLTSRPDRARFDVLLPGADAHARARVVQLCAALRVPTRAGGPIVAEGLDHRTASTVYARLDRTLGARVVDAAFHRWDVRLLAAADHAAAAALLVRENAMRPQAALRLLDHLPVVVHGAVSPARRDTLEAAWAAIGARTSVSLATLQAFHVTIDVVPDPFALATVLEEVLGQAVPVDRLRAASAARSVRIEGPFPRVQVRWLRERLRPLGVRMRLEEA